MRRFHPSAVSSFLGEERVNLGLSERVGTEGDLTDFLGRDVFFLGAAALGFFLKKRLIIDVSLVLNLY